MKRLILLSILAITCGLSPLKAKETVSLNGTWTLQFWPQPLEAVISPQGVKKMSVKSIPAQVPGNVELDMVAAGMYTKDIMVGNNVYDALEYEGYQWCYSRKFATPKLALGQRLELTFDGVDCLADIWINDKHAGLLDNMLIGHTLDITDLVNASGASNSLHVIIRSVLAEAQNYRLGTIAYRMDASPATTDFLSIRKSTHSYGWSILPRIVSGAIFRDVNLNVVDPIRLEDVNWYTVWMDANAQSADVYADFQCRLPVDQLRKLSVEFTLSRNGKVVVSHTAPLLSYAARQHLHIDNAEYWWPRGYGDPALYSAQVAIKNQKGEVLDKNTQDIGLRMVRLERNDVATKENPGRFCFYVNGEKIFIRGTNWVPVDIFYSREKQLLPDILNMVTDLNCNMVRIWGGGLYEHDMFYDFCDRNGIMVWQDFMFACTMYPQDDDFARKVTDEVRTIVTRLRNHPSIALWCGNNESDRSFLWQHAALGIDPNRDRISRTVIPSVLYEFDPTRPYLPSSPYHSPASLALGQGDHILPECHMWSSAYYKDGSYTGINSAFASELGYHGCPNRESLEKMFDPQFVYPWDKDMRWNDQWITKSVRSTPMSGATNGRVDVLTNQIGYLFGSVARTLEEFIVASQVTQAEAYKYFIEFWRGAKFDRTGIIWWNLRDGWPITSDAVVDYYNSKKLAYHYIKSVQQDVCVLINDPVDGFYPLVAVNDTRNSVQGKVCVSDVSTGRILFESNYKVSANGRTVITSLPMQESQGMLMIKYTVGDKSLSNHYLYGNAPFSFDEYLGWYRKAGIYDQKWIDQSKK